MPTGFKTGYGKPHPPTPALVLDFTNPVHIKIQAGKALLIASTPQAKAEAEKIIIKLLGGNSAALN